MSFRYGQFVYQIVSALLEGFGETSTIKEGACGLAADRTAEEEGLAVTSQEMVEALQREAIEQGAVTALAHLFERRLGRVLHDNERACVRERIETLGPERVGDVVLDLSADELAAWLADPKAR